MAKGLPYFSTQLEDTKIKAQKVVNLGVKRERSRKVYIYLRSRGAEDARRS